MEYLNIKTRNIVLATMLIFGMAACSNSDVVDNTEGKTVNTYMTVNVGGASTSRTIAGTTEPGIDPDENTITSLAIALVNKAGSVTLKTDPTLTTDKTTGVVSTAPFPMAVGEYKVFVVANPTATVISKLSGVNNFKDLKGALSDISGYANISTFATSTTFMMANSINYDGDYTNIPTVTVTYANMESYPAHPDGNILVQRLAVKFRINAATSTAEYKVNDKGVVLNKYNGTSWEQVTYPTVKMLGYAMLNTYNKANLYQQWDGNKDSGYAQQLLTPNHSAYDVADYSNGMDTYSTRTKDASTVGYSALVDKTRSSSPMTALNAVSYCLENNAPIVKAIDAATNANVGTTKNKEAVTGVLFRAQVQGTDGKGVTFYSYNDKLYADLASIQVDHKDVFGKATTEKSEAALLTDAQGKTPEAIRTSYGVKVYQDGYMYYTFYNWDKNYTDGTTNSNNHYYATIRNTIYELNVTGLRRVGTDIPGGWDYTGTDKIDDENKDMLIELSVNPWVLDFYYNEFK